LEKERISVWPQWLDSGSPLGTIQKRFFYDFFYHSTYCYGDSHFSTKTKKQSWHATKKVLLSIMAGLVVPFVPNPPTNTYHTSYGNVVTLWSSTIYNLSQVVGPENKGEHPVIRQPGFFTTINPAYCQSTVNQPENIQTKYGNRLSSQDIH